MFVCWLNGAFDQPGFSPLGFSRTGLLTMGMLTMGLLTNRAFGRIPRSMRDPVKSPVGQKPHGQKPHGQMPGWSKAPLSQQTNI